MGDVVALSFTSAANPTLVAVTTVMLLLPSPKRLMLRVRDQPVRCGQHNQHTLNPAADLALGALALTVAFVLGSGRDQRIHDWRERRHPRRDKAPPRWQQVLSKGSARMAFAVGAVLTLPGASYLVGLHYIKTLHYGTGAKILLVLYFNVVMLMLLELPLLGFVLAPEWTPKAIDSAKQWVGHHWHRFAFAGLLVVGVALLIKGIIGLLS